MLIFKVMLCVFVIMINVHCENEIDEFTIEDINYGRYENGSEMENVEIPNQYKNETIVFDNGSNTLSLRCKSKDIIDAIQPFETTMNVKLLILDDCKLPTTPIVETLQALNINPSIEILKLTIRSKTPILLGNYTQGLTVNSLWIDCRDSPADALSNNPDFLQPLSNLTTLTVSGNKVPPIPNNVKLKMLSLSHNANVEQWEGCEYLQELRILNLESHQIPFQWPLNCTRLKTLRLKGLGAVTSKNFISSIAHGCQSLRYLDVQSCNQTDMPYDIINIAKDLVHLNLSQNKIFDQSLEEFPVMSKLTHLDLSSNHLTGWILTRLVKRLPALRYLNLNSNKFTDAFCYFYENKSYSLSSFSSLEWLSLNDMPLPITCFDNHKFSKLKFLGLAGIGYIYEFQFRDLPRTNASHLEVDLRDNVIPEITSFQYNEYIATTKGEPSGFWTPNMQSSRLYGGTNLTLRISYLNCDCKNYWIARALRESQQNFVSFSGARCTESNRKFEDEPLVNMNCLVSQNHGCYFREIGTYYTEERKENKATAECHNMKDKVDIRFYNIIGLNVSDGFLSSIKNITPFTDAIQWIDLRNNNISRLDNNETTLLFSNPERKVWFSRNKIFCDCANKPLLDALHAHKNQVVDFDELICFESGTLLQLVTSYDVCHIGLLVTIGSIGVVLVLLLVFASLYWQYRLQIKIYLYSRGCFLSCLREEDVDADKKYDAFLSYAHGDDQYITEYLLPKLEGEPNNYRICIHFRDWIVGDMIPTQIMRSIQDSKRTIIVLTRNFLASMWGSLEFQYAIASAHEEGRSRLLILVKDDILSQKLDAEMQGYLSFNTYLTCDDPWFWDKLRYAMPRQKQTSAKPLNVSKISDVITLLPIIK